MLERLASLPFSLEDERFSTLKHWVSARGESYYTLQAMSHAITADAHAITPNDPLFGEQWHLYAPNGVNIQEAWTDYRGSGITIGLVDDGVQYTHPDLAANYNTAIDYDAETASPDGAPQDADDRHGTSTGGVAAGVGDNDRGITGTAYEAELANYRLDFGTNFTDAQFASLYTQQLAADVDISSNSWGFGGFFADDFKDRLTQMGDAIEALAVDGRDGLGIPVIVSAGNGRSEGQNTNYHNLQNSPFTISIGATDQNGDITSFSTPGASVLVSAPGLDITSTDRTGSDGYVNGDYAAGLGGTSYSAPIVSGIVGLMLEANPGLGYRDVQEILAYSARNSDPGDASWQTNGAENWNGGGLHFSHDYGFGLTDALAAVRLAESWSATSTYANRDMAGSGLQVENDTIPDNNSNGISRTANVNSSLTIDHVEIDVDIDHNTIGDLIIRLTSPDGTTSTLVDRPGYTGGFFGGGSTQDDIEFTLTSNAFWGEQGDGQWELEVIDAQRRTTGTLLDWEVRLYGDDTTADDTYIYTNEYAEMLSGAAARGALSDDGGIDWLNLAAVSSDTTLSLINGETGEVDGAAFSIADGTEIEHAWLGDGDDMVTGNSAANSIIGARGMDTLEGGAGNDSLTGGTGTDTAIFSGLFSDYTLNIIDDMTLSITDLLFSDGNDGSDWLHGVEQLQFSNGLYSFDGDSVDAVGGPPSPPPPPPPPPSPPANEAPTANNDSATLDQDSSIILDVLANDTDPEDDILSVNSILDAPDHGDVVINGDNTITYTPDENHTGADSFSYLMGDGNGNTDSATVSLTINPVSDAPVNIRGGRGNDQLEGGSNDDRLDGWRGNDSLIGKGGDDFLDGDYGNDTLDGGSGNDTLYGGNDNDWLFGGSGDDTLDGGRGTNLFDGGEGIDLLIATRRATDSFDYNRLSDAGDVIQDFRRGEDQLDLVDLMDSIGYGGNNPVADGVMLLTTGSGGDLIVSIDADGPGGNGPIALLNLDGLGSSTLTLGTDYIV